MLARPCSRGYRSEQTFFPVRRQPSAHRAQDHDRTGGRRIAGPHPVGRHPPGEPLRQELFAEELGVSRIPVREALRLLSAEGLVDTIAHRGAFVTMLSRAEVQEFFELRLRLEPWILREAIPLLEETDLSQASDVVARMDAAEPSNGAS